MNQSELWINNQPASPKVPRRFASDLNLIFLGVAQEARQTLETWLPFFQQIRSTHPQIDTYRLLHDQPPAGPRLSLGLLNLPRKILGRRKNRSMTVALVTQSGDVLWKTQERYTPEAGGDLCTAIVDAYLVFHGRIAPR